MGNITDDVTIPNLPPAISIVVVPFPAQGHLNQLLQLSCLLASRGLPVHYAASATHNRQARARAAGHLNPSAVSGIFFHDLPVPSFHSPSPDPLSTCRFPSHLQPAFDAALHLRTPLAALAAALPGRVVFVHDPLISSVVPENLESYAFNCLSAFCDVKLTHELAGILCPVPALRYLPLISASISDDLQVFIGGQYPALQRSSGSLYNTCRAMEGPFLDILEAQGGRKVWAVGPMLAAKSVGSGSGSGSGKRHECLEWLDGQKVGSVLYVTFGTTCSLTDEEITELALGLESSGHGFLWVLRDADKADVFDRKVRNVQLPSGFEERMKGKGLVVRDWAPQTEILAHGSTGGFMSHCGWNSCIESIVAGVPIAAWPMHSDQPTNAKLVTEILKVGLPVREWSETREVVKASTIESVVRCLMASEDLRKRARDLAATVRGAMEEGGESKLELDSFIAHISRKDA